MELRPPVRPLHVRPREDDSKQMLMAIIILLVGVIAVFAFYSHRTSNAKLSVSNALQQQQEFPAAGLPGAQEQTAPALERQIVYQQPAAPVGPSTSDISRYNSMQESCYRMARMNADGEYPALQQAACNDYARFAASVGIDAGQLPDVRIQQQVQQPAPRQLAQSNSHRSPSALCEGLERQKEAINARTRQSHTSWEAEYFREELRKINAQMWDLNCRNH